VWQKSLTSWINVAFSYLHLTARGDIYISRVRETYLKFVHPVFEGRRRRAEQVHVKFVLPVWVILLQYCRLAELSASLMKRGEWEKGERPSPYLKPNSGRSVKRKAKRGSRTLSIFTFLAFLCMKALVIIALLGSDVGIFYGGTVAMNSSLCFRALIF